MAKTKQALQASARTERTPTLEPRITLEEIEWLLAIKGYGYQEGDVRAANGLVFVHIYAVEGDRRIWIGSKNALCTMQRWQMHLLLKLKL